MSDAITPHQFHDAEGVEDWRVLSDSACTRFRTGSFTLGVVLVEAIGELAESANHHPDVNLRFSSVTVRLRSHDVNGLSQRDVALARRISTAARALNVVADSTNVQDVQVSIDAMVISDVREFWRAVLGYRERGEEALLDPDADGPSLWFQQMHGSQSPQSRRRLDVFVPLDQAETRVAAAIAAGGRVLSDDYAPAWWVLCDVEGNEARVATWKGRKG